MGEGKAPHERDVGCCSQIGLDCLFSYIRNWLAGYSIYGAQRSPFWNLSPPYRRCQVCWGLGFTVQGLLAALGLLSPYRRCQVRFSLFVSLFVTFCLVDLLSPCLCVCVEVQARKWIHFLPCTSIFLPCLPSIFHY